MAKVNTYLNFDGNCEEAFLFYQSVFGGEFSFIGKFGDMPPQEGMPPLSEEEKNRIMHVSLPISGETMIFGSDTMPGVQQLEVGNNFSLSIDVDSREEAHQLFRKLSEEGTISMPLEDTFWGAYFGMLTDKFNINWMVNYDDPANTTT